MNMVKKRKTGKWKNPEKIERKIEEEGGRAVKGLGGKIKLKQTMHACMLTRSRST